MLTLTLSFSLIKQLTNFPTPNAVYFSQLSVLNELTGSPSQ